MYWFFFRKIDTIWLNLLNSFYNNKEEISNGRENLKK